MPVPRRVAPKATNLRDGSVQVVGIEGQTVTVDEAPVEAMESLAKEVQASLIVIGTHGRTGFKRMALGSVAASVVRGAECSVLVVR